MLYNSTEITSNAMLYNCTDITSNITKITSNITEITSNAMLCNSAEITSNITKITSNIACAELHISKCLICCYDIALIVNPDRDIFVFYNFNVSVFSARC